MKVHKVSSDCDEGDCPTVYLADDGMPVFQGYPVDTADGMTLGPGEIAVKLPLDVVLSALPALRGQ